MRATETDLVIPFAATLKSLCVLQNVAGAGTGNNGFFVQVNGVDSALTLSVNATDTAKHCTSTDVSVNAQDLIGVRTQSSGSVTSAPTFVYVTVSYSVP